LPISLIKTFYYQAQAQSKHKAPKVHCDYQAIQDMVLEI